MATLGNLHRADRLVQDRLALHALRALEQDIRLSVVAPLHGGILECARDCERDLDELAARLGGRERVERNECVERGGRGRQLGGRERRRVRDERREGRLEECVGLLRHGSVDLRKFE